VIVRIRQKAPKIELRLFDERITKHSLKGQMELRWLLVDGSVAV